MARQTRHLAEAVGPHSDYFYDKQFKQGPSARRVQKRLHQLVNKRTRAAVKRDTRRTISEDR